MFKIEISLEEYHLTFGALQDKVLQNEREMKSLSHMGESLYDVVIDDQAKYDRLTQDNKSINALLDRIHAETGRHLRL